MFKRSITAALIIMAIATSTYTVEAYEPFFYETWGVVAEASDDYIYLTGEPLTDGALTAVILNIGEAPVYDLLTGYPADPEQITEGMWIRAAYDMRTADTDPPLADAAVVWLHYGEEGSAAFKVTVSENIFYDESDCTFMTADGKYRITLTPETIITDTDDGFIEPDDIQPGVSMFIWVDMVTASSPAQAYPDKVMLIRPGIPVSDD